MSEKFARETRVVHFRNPCGGRCGLFEAGVDYGSKWCGQKPLWHRCVTTVTPVTGFLGAEDQRSRPSRSQRQKKTDRQIFGVEGRDDLSVLVGTPQKVVALVTVVTPDSSLRGICCQQDSSIGGK